jgi:ribosomal protein S18 acetylase RimI-like enzyme
MIEIKKIDYLETFAVRHPVLREGKPVESCFFEHDNAKTTIHLGLFNNKKIIGVVSIFKNKNTIFNFDNQFQIRGMAVLKAYQKQGFGEMLIKEAEKHIVFQNGNLIWFNAREIAVNFYKKMGYSIIGEPFLIGDIGTHFVMKKEI